MQQTVKTSALFSSCHLCIFFFSPLVCLQTGVNVSERSHREIVIQSHAVLSYLEIETSKRVESSSPGVVIESAKLGRCYPSFVEREKVKKKMRRKQRSLPLSDKKEKSKEFVLP